MGGGVDCPWEQFLNPVHPDYKISGHTCFSLVLISFTSAKEGLAVSTCCDIPSKQTIVILLLDFFPSQKPLKRIVIEEIGSESDSDHENEVSTRAQVSASLSTEETRNEVNLAACKNTSDQAENLKVKPNDNAPTMLSSSSATSGHVQSSASTTQSQFTCKSFTVPKTSGQFQADWRALQKDPELLFHYFKVRPTCIIMLMYVCPSSHRLHVCTVDSEGCPI